jgi:hypothetical protein
MIREEIATARYAPGVAAGTDAGSPLTADGGRDAARRRAVEELFPPHQPYPPEPDPVDEASEESFPASDAPSTWSREN